MGSLLFLGSIPLIWFLVWYSSRSPDMTDSTVERRQLQYELSKSLEDKPINHRSSTETAGLTAEEETCGYAFSIFDDWHEQ